MNCHCTQCNSTLLRLPSESALREWIAGTDGGDGGSGGGGGRDNGGCGGGGGRWALGAWVTDRFGDYGLVGCALCSADLDPTSSDLDPISANFDAIAGGGAGDGTGGGAGGVTVESLNMSCRVLHRGVEHAILRRVGADALELGRREGS